MMRACAAAYWATCGHTGTLVKSFVTFKELISLEAYLINARVLCISHFKPRPPHPPQGYSKLTGDNHWVFTLSSSPVTREDTCFHNPGQHIAEFTGRCGLTLWTPYIEISNSHDFYVKLT